MNACSHNDFLWLTACLVQRCSAMQLLQDAKKSQHEEPEPLVREACRLANQTHKPDTLQARNGQVTKWNQELTVVLAFDFLFKSMAKLSSQLCNPCTCRILSTRFGDSNLPTSTQFLDGNRDRQERALQAHNYLRHTTQLVQQPKFQQSRCGTDVFHVPGRRAHHGLKDIMVVWAQSCIAHSNLESRGILELFEFFWVTIHGTILELFWPLCSRSMDSIE